MATTESLSQKNKFFDPIRKILVAITPEEEVRQGVLSTLLSLGYPSSLIGVEVFLEKIGKTSFPQRIDIVVFSAIDAVPILLIECKAQKISQKALQQILAYNDKVQALCVSCISKTEVLFARKIGEQYEFSSAFLSYQELQTLDSKRKSSSVSISP